MNKLFVIGLIAILCACASKPVTNVAGMDLDAAIHEAAAQMERRIPSGTTIALVSIASPSTAFSTQVLTRLESAIVGNVNLVVVDRANLDRVREEQGFQLSGEVSDESAKSIGMLLGAGAIVTGSLTDSGDVYNLTLKAINIENATVAVSYLADLAKTTRIETWLATRDGAGVGGTGTAAARPASATQAQQAVPATPSAPAYRIGDTGPAGGIIFYDKGNNSGGWRYLEAASVDLERAQWGEDHINVSGTRTTIGSGKQNTQLIRGRAAIICLQYDQGGYRDWYLPSKDELDLMFRNLYIIGLGNFSNALYWSSSQNHSQQPAGVAAWGQNFNNGQQDIDGWKHFSLLVRPIRQFE